MVDDCCAPSSSSSRNANNNNNNTSINNNNNGTTGTAMMGTDGLPHPSSYEDDRMKIKENRKKEADMTFLGKIIECGTETRCGEGLFCAAF